ncbi:MAG: D-serine ammonia-lyase [Bacteroidetes bacterium]|nr:D-serine ammonia-lyase [Bacteroidota bacterium]
MVAQSKIEAYIKREPLLADVILKKPVIWLNAQRKIMAKMPDCGLSMQNIEAVESLWARFSPFLKETFTELASVEGKISSPLKRTDSMKDWLSKKDIKIDGQLYVKCDSDLAVAGSIKARGGFYEVLHYAEKLALNAGILQEGDDYRKFSDAAFKRFFSQYKIGVGSTGNLGMSIGIMSARLGFEAHVYVSNDAKQWKKDLLRKEGAIVKEYSGDFSEAILAGRKETLADPKGYFVDDENSKELFIGYSLGAKELQKDLQEQGVIVDEAHPLFVYSPCGVGGSSGGIAFGLREIFGDAVHCFFVEPTHAPAVLIGLATGEMSHICVQDLGIDNKTEADGLAVGRASNFATQISANTISGIYTIEDNELFELLSALWDCEKIFLEPSATAGLIGAQMVEKSGYPQKYGLNMQQATHVAWATGGSLVPQTDRNLFYNRGKKLLTEKH